VTTSKPDISALRCGSVYGTEGFIQKGIWRKKINIFGDAKNLFAVRRAERNL